MQNKVAIPKRKKDANKGDYGRVLIIAGLSGMLGAGVLATRGALRSGAGLVYWAVPKELKNTANLATPEVIVINHDEIKDIKPDAVAIGPGLGQSKEIYNLIHSLVIGHLSSGGGSAFGGTLVIDADGLNVIAKNPKLLSNLPNTCILTPHPGEMARLTGLTVEEVQNNREKIALEYSKKWSIKIVLKGYKTIVAYPNGKLYVNKTGNPGMATAGSGDVLTGVIASFKAQKLCVCNAVYTHGLAGDLARKDKGEYGIIASDIVENLPKAIMTAQNEL